MTTTSDGSRKDADWATFLAELERAETIGPLDAGPADDLELDEPVDLGPPPKGDDWCPNGCQPLYELGECGLCGYQGDGVWSSEVTGIIDLCERTGRYARQTPGGWCYACGSCHGAEDEDLDHRESDDHPDDHQGPGDGTAGDEAPVSRLARVLACYGP